MTAICGCRSVGTHESILKEQISGLDKLGNVMVITREDGSDTRSTFSQLTGFDEKNKETGASDLTRTDAETADSVSLVLEHKRKMQLDMFQWVHLMMHRE